MEPPYPWEGPRQVHKPTRWAQHPTLPSPPAWPGSQELSIPTVHGHYLALPHSRYFQVWERLKSKVSSWLTDMEADR